MGIDFEAEGLLDGLTDERTRSARLDLLRRLETEGFTLEQLRSAAREGRLALLPVERVLEGEAGACWTQRELAEETGLSLEFLAESRRALGQPAIGPDERVLNADERDLAHETARLLAAGVNRDDHLELTRTMSQAMATVAAAVARVWGDALIRPDDTERDLGLRYADSLRELGPDIGPALQHMFNLRLRDVIRQTVVGEAELRSGSLPGSQHVVVAFVDIVGFTRLGEAVPPDELGAVVGSFERRVEEALRPPTRLVKMIGDAAMLSAPWPDPVLQTALALVESSREDDDQPLLRGGVAAGEALPRAGDLYGHPVNLASRLTAFARRGSVVAAREVRDAARGDYGWSFAGSRRLRGVATEVDVFRVRPADEARAAS